MDLRWKLVDLWWDHLSLILTTPCVQTKGTGDRLPSHFTGLYVTQTHRHLHQTRLLNWTELLPFDVFISSSVCYTSLFCLCDNVVSFCVFCAHSKACPARCCVLLSAGQRGLGGPCDAATHSPWVKGENSENGVFRSAGEDLAALFCMLESGQGPAWEWGSEKRRKENETKWLVHLRTNDSSLVHGEGLCWKSCTWQLLDVTNIIQLAQKTSLKILWEIVLFLLQLCRILIEKCFYSHSTSH